MELAMIGLGKMGMNMATRLVRGGHRVIGYARTDATVKEAIQLGAEGAYTLEEAVGKLNTPRQARSHTTRLNNCPRCCVKGML